MESSSSSPTFALTHLVERKSNVIAELLTQGLVGGGLAGPGLRIERRAAALIVATGVGDSAVTRLEVALSTLDSGGTSIALKVWCRHPPLALPAAAVATIGIALPLAGLFGWPLSPAGLLAGLGVGLWVSRASRAGLEARARAYLANLDYLKAQ